MKKNNSLFICFILASFSLSSCNKITSDNPTDFISDSENSEMLSSDIEDSETLSSSEIVTETPTSETTYVENDVEEIPLDLPYMNMSKTVYTSTDTIRVEVYDAQPTDWVGIYGDNEPGWGTSLVWKYVNNDKVLEFPASSLPKNQVFFSMYLCYNGGYDVLDKIDIIVKDNDKTDYGIESATAVTTNVNGIKKSTISITPSTDKELTYELKWAVDTFALDDYTYIKRFKKASSGPFEIQLNDTMYMPDIADSIEISVVEGKSMPYYLYLDETLKLPKSNYLYSFEVLSDIHIENYSTFTNHNSHLKAALRDINSIASNSKAIFTVGDNTNHGCDENYQTLMEIIENEKR